MIITNQPTLYKGFYYDNGFSIQDTNSDVYRSFSIALSEGTYTLSASQSVMLIKRIINNEWLSENIPLPYTFTLLDAENLTGFSMRVDPSSEWKDNIYIELSKEPVTVAEKLTTIAENEQKVFEAGKKSQYDEFWDTAQQKGNRTNYERAFAGMFWTNELLKPKWDIKPKWGGATSLFQGSPFEGNLREHLENLNVTLDVSGLVGSTNMFYAAEKITEIPFLNLSNYTNANTLSGLFYGCKALITAHIKLSENVPMNNNCFTNCTALENLTVEGTIGTNGFDVHWSTKLTKTSLISIVNALSQTAVGRTVTLSKTAVNNAFGINVDDVTTFPEGSEWYNLRNSRSKWTFSYA